MPMDSGSESLATPAVAPVTSDSLATDAKKQADRILAMLPKISSSDIGLKTYFLGQHPEVDIVAVHGLGVNPNETWVHPKTKCHWLKDEKMLPAALPDARIMGFCYDSLWMGEKAVRLSLSSVATKLLEALNDERKHCSERPIVFVGHCLGGLVIQQLYLEICFQSIDFPNVSSSNINGIVFLGTPHQGANGSVYSKQGRIYDAILNANIPMENNILFSMERNNDMLVEIVTKFTRHIHNAERHPTLFCFYEEVRTRVGQIVQVDMPSEFVVDITSGTLNGHKKQGLTLDHFRMNKFENEHDDNYVSVRRVICDMAHRPIERTISGEAMPMGYMLAPPSTNDLPFDGYGRRSDFSRYMYLRKA